VNDKRHKLTPSLLWDGLVRPPDPDQTALAELMARDLSGEDIAVLLFDVGLSVSRLAVYPTVYFGCFAGVRHRGKQSYL
jgi:hypothetical protein